MEFKKAQSYDNISLIPRICSTLEHRSEADTGITIIVGKKEVRFDVPMIAAPMPDVCNGKMAKTLASLGAFGIIHRFQRIMDQVEEFKSTIGFYDYVGCAIGVNGDSKKRFESLYCVGCRIFCVDTANGFSERTGSICNYIKNAHPDVFLIAGNVATQEGYRYLADVGVDAVRVGIAGGSVCETRTETGVYYPMASCVAEIAIDRERRKGGPLIIADGGIRTPSDMCKALCLFADFVMCGSIFAGTSEAPGDPIMIDGKLQKLYRGAASFGIQHEHTGNEPDYVEGRETLVQYKGQVGKIISRFKAGLQSSMSYMNARDLQTYRTNSEIVVI